MNQPWAPWISIPIAPWKKFPGSYGLPPWNNGNNVMRWRSRGNRTFVAASKAIPTGCCPGFFQQWQWDFIGEHGFSILVYPEDIGSLNLFWGQTSQVKLELWEVCVFVKWSTVNSRQDQMIRVTCHLGTCWLNGVVGMMKSPPQSRTYEEQASTERMEHEIAIQKCSSDLRVFLSNPVLSGAAWKTSFYCCCIPAYTIFTPTKLAQFLGFTNLSQTE